MINWLSRVAGCADSSAMVNVSGKEIEVLWSARANRALTQRDRPLVVEIELAFACFARKQVFFHDASVGKNVIDVNGKLALLITTIIPDTCEPAAVAKTTIRAALRNFMPKWVRVDYTKGKWNGEYGL